MRWLKRRKSLTAPLLPVPPERGGTGRPAQKWLDVVLCYAGALEDDAVDPPS